MTIARTRYDELPPRLVTELTDAGLDAGVVYDVIVAALEEDLPSGGDDVASAATISEAARGVADIAAREPGVVAGLPIAELVFADVLGDDVEIGDRLTVRLSRRRGRRDHGR